MVVSFRGGIATLIQEKPGAVRMKPGRIGRRKRKMPKPEVSVFLSDLILTKKTFETVRLKGLWVAYAFVDYCRTIIFD